MTVHLRAQPTGWLAKLNATPVFDSYWRFAAERQEILFRRLAGQPPYWTADPVLRRYKFTNAYRAADRVSQFLIKNVIYGEGLSRDPVEVIFRVLLFKLFNRIETWTLLSGALGTPSWASFNQTRYDKVLASAIDKGTRIYSAAYIIPPVPTASPGRRKHVGHLSLIQDMLQDGFARNVEKTKGLEDLFLLLKGYPSLGNFLAYQLAIDLNYSDVSNHSESEFVVAGPGAIDGISKCFSNATAFGPSEIIRWVCTAQIEEFERRNLDFPTLYGRPLQLIDCQNLFCEISKYARVAHPDVPGVSGRTRIKQAFAPKSELPPLAFPPKWGIASCEQPSAATTLL